MMTKMTVAATVAAAGSAIRAVIPKPRGVAGKTVADAAQSVRRDARERKLPRVLV